VIRFKSEINRLTGGDMQSLLSESPFATELSFPFSYLHAFHWFKHNVHVNYHDDVLESFSRGRQAFLMQLLLRSIDSESFIEGYIQHWLDYRGDTTVQYQQFITLYQHHQQEFMKLE